ncbi:MAG: DUF695 domain-containing protein [Kofleriaceae bacterium]|nr:DUF695 domain-containing protein [Kofleriaceae bacterium]
MTPTTDDAFEFYPCLVDGAPASIYVNLKFDGAVPTAATTRYELAIALHTPGEFGIGEGEEVETLGAAETAVIARAAELDVLFVGRLRHRGIWELTFYGPAGHLAALEESLRAGIGDRRVQLRAEVDAGWRYYNELLLPDAERRRWMDDRRLVQILDEQGDSLRTPRRVDHHLSFPTAAARDAFTTAAVVAGFTVERITSEAPFIAEVWRTDPIELDHIHDVVMTLVDAAALHGGTYDHWLAAIEG